MSNTPTLSKTLEQFIPIDKVPAAITALTAHIDDLDQNNIPLRFPKIQATFSNILNVGLSEEDSHHILADIMDSGYSNAIARLIGLPSAEDLVDFLTEIASNDDAQAIQEALLTFVAEKAHLDADTFSEQLYGFIPTLFSEEILADQVDIMLTLASQINDHYAELLKPVVGMPMIPPTLEDELALSFTDEQVTTISPIIKDYINDKDATNTPIRIPHVYADFLSLVSPDITHEKTRRILMILSLDEAYSEIFSRLLLLGADDLTEYIKVLVEPEDVMAKQEELLTYITEKQHINPDLFMQNVYPEVKSIFDNQIFDTDVDALLYYAMFILE